jgi:diketogulonate reductase-like aldo/keto reductase
MLILGRIVYGNEQAVAIAIRESGLDRSELFVTTKYDGGSVEDRLRESLNKVRTDLHLSWIISLTLSLYLARNKAA